MFNREDPHRFITYYENQAGGALPGFYGSPVMYGRGIGSIFSKLFRFVSPLMKRGFAIVKPHLKSAASGIASDVVKEAVGRMTQLPRQEGSGGIMVLSRRRRKRPPGDRITNKRGSKRKTGSVAARGTKKRRAKDIF